MSAVDEQQLTTILQPNDAEIYNFYRNSVIENKQAVYRLVTWARGQHTCEIPNTPSKSRLTQSLSSTRFENMSPLWQSPPCIPHCVLVCSESLETVSSATTAGDSRRV